VRLVAWGIFHTDIGLIDDWDDSTESVVLGHKGAGVVVPRELPQGLLALLTGDIASRSFSGGRKAFGVAEGDAVPQRFIPRLIDLHREGRFPFDRLVKFYLFTGINRAIADARKGDTIKPVVRIGDT